VAKVELARVPELYAEGGSLLLAPEALDSEGRKLVLLVVNAGPDGFRAYDARCPHEGCAVAWDAPAREVVCPCHLSRFSLDGAVLSRPAKDDLDAYPVVIDTGAKALLINLGGLEGIFPALAGGKVTFTAEDVPELAAPGASVTGHAPGVPFPLLVMRGEGTKVSAFDARCPHAKCTVNAGPASILCACHGSLFSLDGAAIAGPAVPKPLRSLAATFDGTTFVVTVA
jgi:Rieske Fe-S protein